MHTRAHTVTDIFISPTETKAADPDYLSQPLKGVDTGGISASFHSRLKLKFVECRFVETQLNLYV